METFFFPVEINYFPLEIIFFPLEIIFSPLEIIPSNAFFIFFLETKRLSFSIGKKPEDFFPYAIKTQVCKTLHLEVFFPTEKMLRLPAVDNARIESNNDI